MLLALADPFVRVVCDVDAVRCVQYLHFLPFHQAEGCKYDVRAIKAG